MPNACSNFREALERRGADADMSGASSLSDSATGFDTDDRREIVPPRKVVQFA